MTRKDFADRHGVGLSTLSKWLQREGNKTLPPVKFREVTLPNPAPRWPVEVVSPHGWIVRLQTGADVQMLSSLLRALPC